MEASSRIHGSRIRLISKSEIRYEGTLSSIDPVANTVSLKNVRMHGTEGRQAEHQISPSDALYDYIIFRGSDIKDLTVYESKPKTDFVDPAVVTAQPARPGRSVPPNNYGGNELGMYDQWSQGHSRGAYGGYGGYGGAGYGRRDGGGGRYGGGDYGGGGHLRRMDSGKGFARMESGGKGGKDANNRRRQRSGSRGNRENPLATHTGMNFKVTDDDKALERRKQSGIEEEFDFNKAKIDMEKVKEETTEKAEVGYDKKKSFFDSLSCETTERQKGEPSRMTKTMRENNHKQDIETFGADAVNAIERSFTRQRRRGGNRGGRGSGHNSRGGRGGRRGRW